MSATCFVQHVCFEFLLHQNKTQRDETVPQRAKGGQKIFLENQVFLQIYTLTCLMMIFKYFLLGKSLISFIILSIQTWQFE